MDETDIDNGAWQNGGSERSNERKHSRLLVRPLGRMRKTMVLVSSSRGMIYKQYR